VFASICWIVCSVRRSVWWLSPPFSGTPAGIG
jgi:hypothetical protein